MKRFFFLALLTFATSLPASIRSDAAEIEVFFSPNGGAAHAAATAIGTAKKTIRLEAYSIDETEITAALIDAHAKGIDIQIVIDQGQTSQNYSTAGKLKKAGIRTVVDRKHQLHHNKVIIIDDALVVTGSMNFTHSGNAKNAENMLIIHDAAIAARYTADFQLHYDHSDPFILKPKLQQLPPARPPSLSLPLHQRPQQEPLQWHAFQVR